RQWAREQERIKKDKTTEDRLKRRAAALQETKERARREHTVSASRSQSPVSSLSQGDAFHATTKHLQKPHRAHRQNHVSHKKRTASDDASTSSESSDDSGSEDSNGEKRRSKISDDAAI